MSIRNCRLRAGYSQPEVSELIGISPNQILKWEKDKSIPYKRNIMALCNLFGVDDMELLRAEPPLEFDRDAFHRVLDTWAAEDIVRATGVTEKDVFRWRQGGNPSYARLRSICKALGVKPSDFLKEATV